MASFDAQNSQRLTYEGCWASDSEAQALVARFATGAVVEFGLGIFVRNHAAIGARARWLQLEESNVLQITHTHTPIIR